MTQLGDLLPVHPALHRHEIFLVDLALRATHGFHELLVVSRIILILICTQLMATNADTFFNRPNPGDLTRIYTQIAAEIGGTRLVPDDSL